MPRVRATATPGAARPAHHRRLLRRRRARRRAVLPRPLQRRPGRGAARAQRDDLRPRRRRRRHQPRHQAGRMGADCARCGCRPAPSANWRGTLRCRPGARRERSPSASGRCTRTPDSYRDGVNLKRYGINPTFAYRAGERHRLRLGYENFRDERTADRGIPSFHGRPAARPAAARSSAIPADSRAHAKVNAAERRRRAPTSTMACMLRNRSASPTTTSSTRTSSPARSTPNGSRWRSSPTTTPPARRICSTRPTSSSRSTPAPSGTSCWRASSWAGRRPTTSARPATSTTRREPRYTTPLGATADLRCRSASARARPTPTTTASPPWPPSTCRTRSSFSPSCQLIGGLRFDQFNVDFTNNRTGAALRRHRQPGLAARRAWSTGRSSRSRSTPATATPTCRAPASSSPRSTLANQR